jgi:hypothetical protein
MHLHVHALIMILGQVNLVEIYNKRVQCEQSMQQAWVTQERNLILWTEYCGPLVNSLFVGVVLKHV